MSWIDEQPTEKISAALEKYRADESVLIRDCKDASRGDERYGLWLALVNVAMIRQIGLSYRDISDWTWADAYANGYSPRDAVSEALAADDVFSLMGA